MTLIKKQSPKLLSYSLLFIYTLISTQISIAQAPTPAVEKKQHNLGVSINTHFGSFYSVNSNFVELKVPYMISNKLEAGAFFTVFGSSKDIASNPTVKNNFGGFGGIYIAPTIVNFKASKISIPLALGFGSIGYSFNSSNDVVTDDDLKVEDWDSFLQTSIGLAYEVKVSDNSYLDLEIKYRSNGNLELIPDYSKRINGLTIGVGFKTFLFSI